MTPTTPANSPPEMQQEEAVEQAATFSIQFAPETVRHLERIAGSKERIGDTLVKAIMIFLSVHEQAREGFTEFSVRNPRTNERRTYEGPPPTA